MSSKTGTMTDRLMRGGKEGRQGVLLASCIVVCCLAGGVVAANARPSVDESEVGMASPPVQDGPAGEATAAAGPLDAPGSCLPRFARPELLAEVQSEGIPGALVAVDLNRDGLTDIFSASTVAFGTVAFEPVVLLNDGSGGFQDATASLFDGQPPKIASPSRVIVADFNTDGRPDLFVAEGGIDTWPWSGGQSVLVLSAPEGKLVDATDSLPDETGFTHSAAAADIDGDSDVDLFLGNIFGDPPQLWLNDGEGGFTRGQEERLPQAQRDLEQNKYTASFLADVDGDGASDLILGACGALCGRGDVSIVLLNDGQGWFSLLPDALPLPSWQAADNALDIQAVDLNDDHRLDLLIYRTTPSYAGGHIQVLIGNGDGTFRDETDTRLPQDKDDLEGISRLRLIDLDYDGDLDLATGVVQSSFTGPFYLNDGHGHFSAWEHPLALSPFDFGDVDGDGRRDLLFALDRWNEVPDRYFAMRGLPCPVAFLPLVVTGGEPSEPEVDGTVRYNHGWGNMWGAGWTEGETLNVDVRTPSGALKDTTFGIADSQGEMTVRFHHPFGGPREGDRITLVPTDGAPVTFPVKVPQATADPKANTIVGIAEPGARVEAQIIRPGGPAPWLETEAAVDGAFSFDFSPLFDWAGSDLVRVGQWVTDYASIFLAEDSAEMTFVGAAHINLGSPYQTLDPAFAESASDFHVANQLFAGFTRQDEETGQILPDLASSWEIAPDAKSIIFHLPIGVTAAYIHWSNGADFDDEDLILGLQRGQEHSPYSDILDAIGVVDYGYLGPGLLRIELDKPMAGVVPAIMAMPPFRPVPKHLIETHGDNWTDPDTIVGSGPFRVVVEDSGLLQLERNPYYHDIEAVTISEVELYAIEDAVEATQRYAAGDLDVTMTYDEDMVDDDPVLKEELHRYTRPCTDFYNFTTTKPPLDNVLVRKALIAATNRAGIVEAGYGQAPALTFAPPGVFGAVPPGSGIGIEYDPLQARAWLDQSGVDTPFTLTLAHNATADRAAIAQRIADDWETNLGIEVIVESRDWDEYQEWISPDTPVEEMPHAWRWGWCADYYDQHNWVYEGFNSEGGSNWIRWSNTEFDDITTQAATSADLAQREVWYRRAEEILNEEQAGILSLYWYGDSQLSKPYLERTFSRNMGEQVRNWYFR